MEQQYSVGILLLHRVMHPGPSALVHHRMHARGGRPAELPAVLCIHARQSQRLTVEPTDLYGPPALAHADLHMCETSGLLWSLVNCMGSCPLHGVGLQNCAGTLHMRDQRLTVDAYELLA